MEEKDIKEFIYDMESYSNDAYLRPINRIIEVIDTAKQKKLDKSIFNILLNYYELY
jgi:DNA polymerase elongation subunit (family B)